MFKNLRLVYITTGSEKEAQKIGKTLVEEELAACVNITDGMKSIYRWEGEVREDRECVLIAKTPYHNMDELTHRVKQLHSYDCPCVVSFQMSEQEGNEAYQQWLIDEAKERT